MMLYDRIRERIFHSKRTAYDSLGHELFLSQHFEMAQVYELSNVLPLLNDWENNSAKGLCSRTPKRKPVPF